MAVAAHHGQPHADGGHLRRPGDTAYRAFKLDVLGVANGRIVEITTFGAELFPAFGLPAAA